MDLDALSPSQTQAFNQLQTLTNGGDPDVAVSVLDSVNWDVQVRLYVSFCPRPQPSSAVAKRRFLMARNNSPLRFRRAQCVIDHQPPTVGVFAP